MSDLTREQILASRGQRELVPLEVPEWGGTLYVRTWVPIGVTVDAGDSVGSEQVLPMMVALLVDKNGDPIFTADDISWLRDEDSVLMTRVIEQVWETAGLREEDAEAAVRDFDRAPSGVSSSASPSPLESPRENSPAGSTAGS